MMSTVPWYGVILLGFGTVFVGLIVLILIVRLMGVIVAALEDKSAAAAPVKTAETEEAVEIADRGAFVAAIASSIATVMGTDVTGLRIHSIKKVN